MSLTRLDIDPSIIAVVRGVGAKYADAHRLDAPTLHGEPKYLTTEGPCACKQADKKQGFYKPFEGLPKYETGHCTAFDNVCAQCHAHWDQFVKIICKNCKIPVMWVVPHRDDKGFVFQRGKVYHVTACPTCSPEVKVVVPLEKIAHDYRKSGSNLPLKDFMRQMFAEI